MAASEPPKRPHVESRDHDLDVEQAGLATPDPPAVPDDVCLAEGTDPIGPLAADADIEDAIRRREYRGAVVLLMNRYGDRVYRLAYAMLQDRWRADEVRQQVFVEAYSDLEDFELRSPVRVWLLRIARNRSIDAGRRKTSSISRFTPLEAAADKPHDGDLGEAHDLRKLVGLLPGCLARLAPATRMAVALRYGQDLSYEEAAKITGERPGTLQRRVARAIPLLRRCLDAKLRGGSR